MKTCEFCNNEIQKTYASGRFCNQSCASKYVSNQNRDVKNKKIAFSLKKSNNVELTCFLCDNLFVVAWNKRNQKFCSKKCSSISNMKNEEIKQKIRKARLDSIEEGNVGYGIKCSYDGIKCDSVLEYAFLKWFKQKNPNSKISRYHGSISSHGITYIPDFLIDDSIIVEVKFEKDAINYKLGNKWKGYIELQEKKKEILKSLNVDFIWFTNKTCGQKFYKECLKEIKNGSIAQLAEQGTLTPEVKGSTPF